MNFLILVIILISFLITNFALPFWIKGTHKRGLVGKDLHKVKKINVAESGGMAVVLGVCAGILIYIAVNTFVFNNGSEKLIYIFAILSTLLIATIVGMIDDLWGWKRGLSKKTRIFIVLFAAIPLMVINAGESIMYVPFLGNFDFGLIYPLLIVPIGILGATTTYNFLAGYNGLEASQGIIILSSLAIATYLTGNSWLSLIALIMVASLFAFYLYNKYPAKVFPGDVLTYSIGAMIAIMAILGNIEKIAIFFFIPYIIETILKSRGKLKKESFARLNRDGSLDMPYKKIYGLEHLAIYMLKKVKKDGKVYEKDVVYSINAFQILIIIIGFLLFI